MVDRDGEQPDRPGRDRDPIEDWRQAIGDDYGDIPTPTCWTEVPSADAAEELNELRAWVEGLCRRLGHLDHHVIPRCWWLHNEHVEALVALRDHERSSFSDTAPATAPVDWFRALRDVAALLRAWTAEGGCGANHQAPPVVIRPVGAGEWDRFVEADVAARQAAEIEAAADE
ncbi:MAG: hypothetical protein ACRD0J_02435 [Acidimicrobiales bacterium]